MSNTHTCQRGGRPFAVAAGGPGSDGGAVSQLMNSFPPQTRSVSRGGTVPTKFTVTEFTQSVLCSFTGRLWRELGSWGSGNTDATSQSSLKLRCLNCSPEESPAASHPSSWRNLLNLWKWKCKDLRYHLVSGQSRELSPSKQWLTNIHLWGSPAAKDGVFFKKRQKRENRKMEKENEVQRGPVWALRRDSGSPVEKHRELLNVKHATLTTIYRHD